MTTRRRLLLVATEFPPGPGGIGTHAYQLAVGVSKAGWDVTVIAAQDYASVEDSEAFDVAQPFPVVRFENEGSYLQQSLSRIRASSRLADHLDPDLVVASGSWAVWLTALAPGIRRRRTVSVGHGMEFGTARSVNHLARRYAYERSTSVVCVSDYTCRRMREAGIHPRQVEVIPNGGDSDLFAPGPGAKPELFDGQLRGKPLLLTVGNVSERKGQDVVVDALPLLVEQGFDVHYLVVGLPTRSEALVERARGHGVQERVHIAGLLPTDELVRAYQSCDVFAMTSREASNGDFEGYGIAVLEAALCGKPSVVTANSGLEEAVIDGETGLVVPQNDPQAFAGAAGALLADGDLQARLGAAARDRTLGSGTWERRVAQYVELFEQIAWVPCGSS